MASFWVPGSIAWLGLLFVVLAVLVVGVSYGLLRWREVALARRGVTFSDSITPTATGWRLTAFSAVALCLGAHLMARAHVPWTLSRMTAVGIGNAHKAEDLERRLFLVGAIVFAGSAGPISLAGWAFALTYGRSPVHIRHSTRLRGALIIVIVSLVVYLIVYHPALAHGPGGGERAW